MPHARTWHNPLPAWLENLQPALKPYQRVILQVIANHCRPTPVNRNGDMGYCWIGYDQLAARGGMCRMTAIRHVKNLIGMGALILVKKGSMDWRTGECFANVYAISGTPRPQEEQLPHPYLE